MSAGIEIRRDGAVVSAAFDRPEKKNAVTSAMYEALIDVFDKAERDPDVGALVLSGAGGVFTAGNDINDFLAVATGAASGSRDIRDAPGWRFISRLAGFEKPLVAAVQGQAVGIGTTLCFHCDLVYASADARFHMPFVNLGLVPEAGASLLAPLRFGRAKASEFLLLAEPFGAEAARELGLVNAVLPQSSLLAHAMSKAAALAAKPRSALLAARRLMRGDPAPLKARMEEEIAAFSAALASGEARAAFMAFLSGAKG
jgi:enoyl-CoA hydratase/carnithine racemase